ncbi:MAG TPA: YjfB family protein [Bacillota bacterium]
MDSDMMGIASASTGMKQNQILMAVQTQMLRTSMDNQAQAVQSLLEALPVAGPSHLGTKIDITV